MVAFNPANIPIELRNIPSWLVWRYQTVDGRQTKVPYDAKNPASMASVTNPNHYSDFQTAFNAYNLYNFDGVGFVFTASDPYCFVDLDDPKGSVEVKDRQVRIFEALDSWSEISPSGKGLHIIVKASVPRGKKRGGIELYSSARYATFTGNIYHDRPIKNCQEIINKLWEEIGGDESKSSCPQTFDFDQTIDDDEVIRLGLKHNSEFENFMNAESQGRSPSQTAMALMNVIWFYSKNNEQSKRIFMRSAFGKEEKYKKRTDYLLDRMLAKAKDQTVPPVDIEALTLEDFKPIPKAEKPPVVFPPGLLGEIASFIYAAAPRPVPEIALAGAIGFMAGICGRAFNVSNTGLNQYVVLLAKTGVGKEAMAQGVEKLIKAMPHLPTAKDFVGPSRLASGIALHTYVGSHPTKSFVSIIGEFGHKLKQMSATNSNGTLQELKATLLEFYNKSGVKDVMRPVVYADTNRNIASIESPNFSLLCESNPKTFYDALDEDMISEGLLPRFLVIEYDGIRHYINKAHSTVEPQKWLVDKLSDCIMNASNVIHRKSFINVELNVDAHRLSDEFDRFTTDKMNESSVDINLHLWNRAHLKALKLAALVAVGINWISPVITKECLQWAMDIVNCDITNMQEKFEAGEIGQNGEEVKQLEEVKRIIKEFLTMPWSYNVKYTDAKTLFNAKIIPYDYINKRLSCVAVFKNDKFKASVALKRTIQTLVDIGFIAECNKSQLIEKYKTGRRAFVLTIGEN